MNNSGNIKLFTNDNSTNVKKPTVTIQEIGSTTGWGSAIDDIPIGQTTSADGSFNKMVVKHNLDVSGNVNINGQTTLNNSRTYINIRYKRSNNNSWDIYYQVKTRNLI